MSRIYIAAGSNLGDRLSFLEAAFERLCFHTDFKPCGLAAVYETLPVGGPEQGNFLNTLWVFETSLAPEDVLARLQSIEESMGRIRAEKNGPRIIDLDLIAYDECLIQNPVLEVPHPRMTSRWFVLKPLCDVAPQWKHPLSKKTAAELLRELDEAGAGELYRIPAGRA